jgi:hypothetical protein
MNWNITVLIICFIVCAVAVWKEVIRINRARLGLRIVAVIVAAVALVGIALPLTYQVDTIQQNKPEVILLTTGFNPDSLSRYNNSRLFTLDNSIKKRYQQAILLNTIDELATDSSVTQLRVFGDGFDDEQLQQLHHLPVIFHPEVLKQGIMAISWNEWLKTGEELRVQGTFKNSSIYPIKLLLNGLGTSLDSVVIKPKSTATFQLKNTPKISGRAVYHLLTITGRDTLGNESLPIQIEAAIPLKVLMLTASPDFESRFLKNWLSANGYAVAARSAISKDKFNNEFINLEQVPLEHLSAQTIGKFDVLVGDLSVLKSLSTQEAAVLKTEVSQKGLGIIVRADSSSGNSWLQHNFPVTALQGRDTLASTLIIRGRDQRLAKLNPGSFYIRFQQGTQPLIQDEHGRILVSSTLAGNGKLIYTSLSNTFNWMLAGNENDYTALWALLIHQASRKAPIRESWSVSTLVPTVLNPVSLQLQSSGVATSMVGSIMLAPQQSQLFPFEYQYPYWPQRPGWQSVKTNNGALNWWYVYQDNEWKSLRILKKQSDTKNYSINSRNTNSVTKQIQKKATISVSKIYAYILLLLACTFLWFEAKVSGIKPSSKKEGSK